MKLSCVLFDLDGTLLPMEEDRFMELYFGSMTKHMAPRGYEPQELVRAIWKGTAAMVRNDGSKTNETAFWDSFAVRFGEAARRDEVHFTRYYEEGFPLVKAACGFDPAARTVVDAIAAMGLPMLLATNPVFPRIATDQRIAWAGLDREDFRFVTTYECASFCKPSPLYYKELLDRFGYDPRQCLMVGNDVTEDMEAAKSLGMEVFLLPRCLINRKSLDISAYPQGTLADVPAFVEMLLNR